MSKHTRKEIKGFRHKLEDNPTTAETALMEIFKSLGLLPYRDYRFQQVFYGYICDFYIYNPKRMMIEVDGSSHNGRETYDERRAAMIISHGRGLLRFTNEFVLNHPNEVRQQLVTDLGL